jgi:hypothetical protein
MGKNFVKIHIYICLSIRINQFLSCKKLAIRYLLIIFEFIKMASFIFK